MSLSIVHCRYTYQIISMHFRVVYLLLALLINRYDDADLEFAERARGFLSGAGEVIIGFFL